MTITMAGISDLREWIKNNAKKKKDIGRKSDERINTQMTDPIGTVAAMVTDTDTGVKINPTQIHTRKVKAPA